MAAIAFREFEVLKQETLKALQLQQVKAQIIVQAQIGES
jgi:hypothetical protein